MSADNKRRIFDILGNNSKEQADTPDIRRKEGGGSKNTYTFRKFKSMNVSTGNVKNAHVRVPFSRSFRSIRYTLNSFLRVYMKLFSTSAA